MKVKFLFLLTIPFFFSACNKFDELDDIGKVNFDAEYAIPLIDTELSLEDILLKIEENSSVQIDPDGLIRFMYSGDVITKNSDEVFATINETLAAVPLIPLLSKRQALPFSSPDGLDMDRLDLKGGSLVYGFENDHDEAVDVEIVLPTVTKNGEPLSFEANIGAYSGSGDRPRYTNLFLPADLTGYRIVPEENDSVYIEYEAVSVSGDTIDLYSIAISIGELEFEYAEGYLGNQIYEGGRDTIEIDFFENWIQGDVYFEEPKITFNFENSFGIPTRSVVNVFDIFTVKGEVLPLRSEVLENGIDFPYPNLSEIGVIKNEAFVFTKENSNIDSVLGAGPIAIDYDVNAFTNPDSLTDIRGFITDSSYYKVRVDVELPLHARASNFLAQDSIELDLNDFEDANYVEFKLITDNSLPLDVDVQAYFLDENGTVLDSLLDDRQRLVAGAPVDAEGNALEPVTTTTFVPLSADRFAKIKTASVILLNAVFSTVNDGEISVKIKEDQNIKIRLGAKLGIDG